MLWLTWRQFRASAAAVAAALAALALVLALTGPGLAHQYASGLASCAPPGSSRSGGGSGVAAAGEGPIPSGGCTSMSQWFFHQHRAPFLAVTAVVLVLPALVGLFWGAPLITRELETGTHRLVWNQTITRTRWLAVKLGLIGLVTVAAAGLCSLAVTWWSSSIDRTAASDFPRMEPLLFAARGIVPAGYAAFAFALGVTVGMLLRHTLPAMAVTLAVFVALQVAVPLLVRPHLLAPVHATVELTEANPQGFKVARRGADQVTVDAGDTGAWFLSSQTVDASGQAVDAVDSSAVLAGCRRSAASPSPSPSPSPQGPGACLAEINRLGYRQHVTYQPAGRFWPFQWIETGIYLVLTLGLAGFCLGQIRRRPF
jgi:hypothetical protein